jgi:hypothetical protein
MPEGRRKAYRQYGLRASPAPSRPVVGADHSEGEKCELIGRRANFGIRASQRFLFVLDGTKKERYGFSGLWENNVMAWVKDVAAGLGLLLFLASFFILADAAQGLLSVASLP